MSVNKRTVFKPNKQEIINYAAQMANQSQMRCGHIAAVQFLQRVLYAQKGDEKREIDPKEAARMLTT
jgi:hypothetical protein